MDPTASTNPAAHTPLAQESSLHETSTIALRPIIKFTIYFVVGLVIVHVFIVLPIFFAFRKAAAQERQITGVDAPRIAPPPPRLEPSIDHNRLPADDLRDLRARETAELKRRGLLNAEGRPDFDPRLVQQIADQAVKDTKRSDAASERSEGADSNLAKSQSGSSLRSDTGVFGDGSNLK